MNPSTLVEFLRYRSQHQPDEIAYTFLLDGENKAVHLTYAELEQKARNLANQLVSFQGERAILIYPYEAGLEFVIAFFGCLYAGVVAVPCHPPRNHSGISDVQSRLQSSQAVLLLTIKKLSAKFKTQLSKAETHLSLFITDQTFPTKIDCQLPHITAETLAFLQYTSGSTGFPKGVMITHQCILANQEMLKAAFGEVETAVGVCWLPLFHDMGLIGHVIHGLYLGRPCVFLSPIHFIQKPIRWLQAISKYQATISGGPNFAYDLLCHHITPKQAKTLDLSHWRIAFCGAETVRAATLKQFSNQFADCGFQAEAFYPCYGMAEATLFIAGGDKNTVPTIKWVDKIALENNKIVTTTPDKGKAIVSCGREWLDEQILMVEPESCLPCSPHQVGEIWLSGSGIGKGYWQDPQKTEETFKAYLQTGEGPFLRTGDLGFFEDKELFITGRLSEMMIFWGFNYYPQQIEETVASCHPFLQVNRGAAFAVEVAGEDRLVIAFEVNRQHRQQAVNPTTFTEIVEKTRWKIFEEHFIDVYSIILLKPGSLPVTSSGKIKRGTCREQFLNHQLDIIAKWQSPNVKNNTITELIQYYLRPQTHLRRFWIMLQGKWYRLTHSLFSQSKQQITNDE